MLYFKQIGHTLASAWAWSTGLERWTGIGLLRLFIVAWIYISSRSSTHAALPRQGSFVMIREKKKKEKKSWLHQDFHHHCYRYLHTLDTKTVAPVVFTIGSRSKHDMQKPLCWFPQLIFFSKYDANLLLLT